MEETLFKVGGLSCQGCVKNINQLLLAMPGVNSADVSLEAGEAKVAFDPAKIQRLALLEAIEDAGFDAE